MSLADNYTAASGATVYGGQAAPSSTPAWMATAGVALNKLVAIPNSASGGTPAASQGTFAFSGLVSKRDTCELFAAANGGHGDSSDNGVYSFGPKGQGLLADNPTWIRRCASTVSPVPDIPLQSDGKPTSRHTYSRLAYSSLTRQIIMVGGDGMQGGGFSDTSWIHKYNVDNDVWDAPEAYTYNGSTFGFGLTGDPQSGLIWLASLNTWNPLTKAVSSVPSAKPVPLRFPAVVAPDLNILFCLQIGDGWTNSGSTINASKVTLDTKIQTAITFNASAAYTQFVNDLAIARFVPGMDYDSINGVFYWYQGQAGQENHLYVIRPNVGSVWDMELFSFAIGSATMTTQSSTGFCGRLEYFPLLKGVVLYPIGPSNLNRDTCPMYFLKTSV